MKPDNFSHVRTAPSVTVTARLLPVSSALTPARRRSTLPSTSPTSSVSLWNILKNNIGKDLSKVAMPVQLNEPLNTLQRLCEELEYSELLDKAAETEDPLERMVGQSAGTPSFNTERFSPTTPLCLCRLL